MKIFLIIFVMVLFFCVTMKTNGDDKLRYNIHEHEYQSASPDARLEYNIHEGRYEYMEKGDKLEYNVHEHEYQTKEGDSENGDE